jgi:OOP family OmpA-OmpF porin
MKKIILAVAAVTALSANTAFADNYVGGSVGSSHVNIDCTGTTNCNNNGTAFKLFGGYKFTPNVAAEISYFDFGKAKATVAPNTISISGTGLGFGVAAFTEFAPQWKGVGRLGIASTSVKASVSGAVNGSDTDHSTNAYAGLGVGYELQKGLTLDATLDFTRLKYASESANVRVLSVGLTYAF